MNFYYLSIEKAHKKEASDILHEAFRGLRYSWEDNKLHVETTFQIIDELTYTLCDNGVEILEQYEDCIECSGSGIVEIDRTDSCGQPASNCCGACYIDIICPECNGNKTVILDI